MVAWGGIKRSTTSRANTCSNYRPISWGTRWGTPNRPAENRKLRLRTTDISAAALDYLAFAPARQTRKETMPGSLIMVVAFVGFVGQVKDDLDQPLAFLRLGLHTGSGQQGLQRYRLLFKICWPTLAEGLQVAEFPAQRRQFRRM